MTIRLCPSRAQIKFRGKTLVWFALLKRQSKEFVYKQSTVVMDYLLPLLMQKLSIFLKTTLQIFFSEGLEKYILSQSNNVNYLF